jgi:cyclohexanecarboxylate-CoA ligase
MSASPAVSLLARLDHWRRVQPDQQMIIEYDVYASRASGAPVRRGTITWLEFWNKVIALGAALRQQGVVPGDVVAIQLPTWHEYFVAQMAGYAIGAVIMPISPIFRSRDVARQLTLGKARAYVVPGVYGSFDFVGMARELRNEVASLEHVIVVGDKAPADMLNWSELLTRGGAADAAADRERIASGSYVLPLDAFSLFNFTSGTTGDPKGVMHSTASVHAAVSGATERMQLTHDDILFVAVTLGHAGGFLNGIFMPLHLGATVVYMDLWDADIALHLIEHERITYGPAMPTFLFDLANHPDFGKVDISSWRVSRVSGGAITRSLMASLQQRLPHLRLCPGWGMSEALYVTAASPDDTPEKRNLTEGKPLDGFQLTIRDSTFTHELPQGTLGELLIKTPSLMLGYCGQEALTKAAYTADGWLKTGDLGFLDADGFLVIAGRSKELIIRGGENVPIVDVQNLLGEHDNVATAVLVGVPDPRLGEKVCAVVERKDVSRPFTLEEMRAFLVQKELTRQFIPEYLVLTDALPRTAVGKVKLHEVRALALATTNRPGVPASAPSTAAA